MLLPNACRHPNQNGNFCERLSKQSDVTTLTWGKGACKFLRHEFDMMTFFLRTRTQPGKDFVVYGCANTSLNKLPFALATTSIQTHSHLQSCYLASKEAQVFFVYGCANASLNKFPFALAKTPIETHFHLHSCYPQTKNVPPRLQK